MSWYAGHGATMSNLLSRTMVRSAANHATLAFYIQLKVQFLCHAPPLVKSSNPDSFNTLEVWL
jgi:hypothetical protein